MIQRIRAKRAKTPLECGILRFPYHRELYWRELFSEKDPSDLGIVCFETIGYAHRGKV